MSSVLWDSKQAVCNIPSLCIHLDTDRAAFSPNKETHLKPILATTIVDQLMGEGITAIEDKDDVFNIQ